MTDAQAREALLLCDASCSYFIDNFVLIYDATDREWKPFHLWPFQHDVLKKLEHNHLVIILKARQLGLTWLCEGYALWLMLFRPAATILLFSRRADEAWHLLERLIGMFNRLPLLIRQYAKGILTQNKSVVELGNGSVARAFPTSGGDSYTATFALADEFDLVEDQDNLITSVKPTIDGGGQMVLLSRADKERPQTAFKNTYRAAKAKQSKWVPIFLPWYSRPDRDQQWYEDQRADSIARTTALDDVYEQYPATDTEALAPPSLNKRLPAEWLTRCYAEWAGVTPADDAPTIPGLVMYIPPLPGREYVIGGDPAEGNPTSDDSSADVLDFETGEQVATFAGKFQPDVFGSHVNELGKYYNRAQVLIERNNHGHAVIQWLGEHGDGITMQDGTDSKPGWLTTMASKANMYDVAGPAFRQEDTRLHSFASYVQLCSIEAATNRAPEGEMDDRAISYALALVARGRRKPAAEPATAVAFKAGAPPRPYANNPALPGR